MFRALLLALSVGLLMGCDSTKTGGSGSSRSAAAAASTRPPPIPDAAVRAGLKRGVALLPIRDDAGGGARLVDRLDTALQRELAGDGRWLMIGPDPLAPILDGRVPTTHDELVTLGRRAGVEMVLAVRLAECRVEQQDGGSFTLPLPGVPVPGPVPVPGLGGVPINNRRVQVTLALEGRLLDTSTGSCLAISRGSAVRVDKSSRLFTQPEIGTVADSLLSEAVADLVTRLHQRAQRQPWSARVVRVEPDGRRGLITAGATLGLRPGDQLEIRRCRGEPDRGAGAATLPDAVAGQGHSTVALVEVLSVEPTVASVGLPAGGAADARLREGDLVQWSARPSRSATAPAK